MNAQEFTYGTDLIFDEVLGAERLSGAVNGGLGTAYMNYVIEGNQLTAVLRNTSPNAANYGGNSNLSSPALIRFEFDVVDFVGGNPLTLHQPS